jgi:hypothetical protein
MNTKDKDIRYALETKEVGTTSKFAILRHKSEVDKDENNHDYQTKTVRAVLTGNTVNDNIDFNIPLTDTSIGVIEFQSSDFTVWINFRLFFMCLGAACINIAKNQFIFMVMIKCKGVDVPDTITDN